MPPAWGLSHHTARASLRPNSLAQPEARVPSAVYHPQAGQRAATLLRSRQADVLALRAVRAWRALALRAPPRAAVRALARRAARTAQRGALRAWTRLVKAARAHAWGALLRERALKARCARALAAWVAMAQGLGGDASTLECLLKRQRLRAAGAAEGVDVGERLQQLNRRYGAPTQLFGAVGYLPGLV